MVESDDSSAPCERAGGMSFNGVLAPRLGHRARRALKRDAQRDESDESMDAPTRAAKRGTSRASSAVRSKRVSLVATVPLSANRFAALAKDMAVDGDATGNAPSAVSTKVAPITVVAKGDELKKMYLLLTGTEVKYTTKMVSIGLRIHPIDLAAKSKILDTLKEQKHSYFTHPEKKTNAFRQILTGMPAMSPESIFEWLSTEHDACPSNVKMLPSSSKTSDRRLYLVEWGAGVVTKAKVLAIKALGHHRVGWEQPRKRANGPTMCRKCQMYGHGMTHCFRDTACGLCAFDHPTAECPLNNDKDAAKKYKCINCICNKLSSNHRADWDKCPSRTVYMATRSPNTAQRQIKPAAKQPTAPNIRSNVEFPQFQRSSIGSPAAQPVFAQQSYASAAQSPSSSQARCDAGANLFSMDQIATIMGNTLEELSKCTSKVQQLQVVAKMIGLAYV